ncbi:MAG: ABC transporter permease [Bdellovibrionales bacterium]|nr:ABC transporter permease [Bdellovibrionales bacterium]
MIELKNILKSYPLGDQRIPILKGISLTVGAGEFVAIMGPSGSGKSTLMNVMGLLDRPDSGSYLLDGQEVQSLDERNLARARRETLGFVFQQFHLLPRLSALENVSLPLLYSIRSMPLAPAERLLRRVGLGDRMEHRPAQLSGGQQQRVAIARSLIQSPRIILADEPTGNLDTRSSAEILSLLRELNLEGMTVILVTHEADVANAANRIITIRDGRIESDLRKSEQNPIPEIHGKKTVFQMAKDGNRYLELFKQAGRTLIANKLRTVLSTLGVLIGVAAVIAMLAIGKGAQEAIETQLSSLGSNLLSVRPAAIRIGGVTMESDWLKITKEDAEAILLRVPEAKQTGCVVQANNQRVAWQEKNAATQVFGTQPLYARMHALIPVVGRYFTDDENQSRALVTVIGATVSRELFGLENPVGKTIKVNRIPMRVIGMLPEKGASSFGDRDDQIHVPLHTAMFRLFGKSFLDFIEVEIEKGADMGVAQNRIDSVLRSRHDIPPSQTEEAFRIFNMADLQSALSETSKTMSLLLLVIAGISLFVGGIGIMNIMLVSVTERTREIGLRKAIGGTSGDILLQFLVESAAIGVIGGVLGVLAGSGTALLVSLVAGWTTSISPAAVLGSFIFSSLIGMVFGLWPARRAAQLNPIDALKGE